MWGFGWNATYYVNYDAERSYGTGDLYNAAGTLGLPEWRQNFLVSWEMDGIFSSLNYDYIGESKSNIGAEKWDSWGIFNLAVGYSSDDYGTVTIGANNLLDEDPLLDSASGDQVDENQYDNTGRVIYVSYSIEF